MRGKPLVLALGRLASALLAMCGLLLLFVEWGMTGAWTAALIFGSASFGVIYTVWASMAERSRRRNSSHTPIP